MSEIGKEQVLEAARKHVRESQEKIKSEIERSKNIVTTGAQVFKGLDSTDRLTQDLYLRHIGERRRELEKLYPSPYFVRCQVTVDGKTEAYYFAKFSFSEHGIYSWTVPAAALRFEIPGQVAYEVDDNELIQGTLVEKNQYMIVDGSIIFLTSESVNSPRELIYQEHFSTRKTGFILPEIVAQMEKAQDQVIRAHHTGPFVISGPAGSGKTTLALHRVAYLVQSPDTADMYPSDTIIVFVQDTGTRDYFSHLLPELGINDVTITTFSEWAIKTLGVTGFEYQNTHSTDEAVQDAYTYHKLQVLRAPKQTLNQQPTPANLEKLYSIHFSAQDISLWQKQLRANTLDRIDLTIMLQMKATQSGLTTNYVTHVKLKNGKYKKKVEVGKLAYTLLVIDEFQNYLPEQLKLLKSCAGPAQSIVYVGDMAQQTQLGTIQKWEMIDEQISEERNVSLQKVYRNTRQILNYITSLGYKIEIPTGIREGAPVTEKTLTTEQEIDYIKALIQNQPTGSFGILTKESTYLEPFRLIFADQVRVHVLTMSEAQGVEFDTVCIVGIQENTFRSSNPIVSELQEEKKRINKDLLYVALTRAISELHVLGTHQLTDVIGQ